MCMPLALPAPNQCRPNSPCTIIYHDQGYHGATGACHQSSLYQRQGSEVHAPHPISNTADVHTPPFTYGASCLSSDSPYPITQSSPWRMPLILTLPHVITIKLHAHNLQSTSATVHALHFHCLPCRTHDASPHPPHIAKVHASDPLSINTDMSALYPPRRMPLILIQSWSKPVLIFTQFLRLSRCTTVAGATVTVCKL
jgi:hypothetical protein